MNEQQLHDVALAYAKIKFEAYHNELCKSENYNPLSGDEDELYEFAKLYNFALENFERLYDSIG